MPLKVAHVRDLFLPISETFIYQILNFTVNTHPVVICTYRSNIDVFAWDDLYQVNLPQRFSRARIVSKLLRMSRIKSYATALDIPCLDAIRKVKPDLVHAHFGPECVKALYACEKLHLPIVCGFYGYDFSLLPAERVWQDAYKHLFASHAQFTVASEYAKQQLEKLGCPGEKITIIRYGIDLTKFEIQPRPPFNGRKVRLVGVGRLVEKKGTEYTLRALAEIKDQVSFQYTHIGTGELEKEIQSLVSALGLDGQCIFMGAQTHEVVQQTLRESDILLMPSVTSKNGDTESQGVALQEAQAVGLPVIATIHNGFPEGMLDGKSGYLVPERNVAALSQSIVRLTKESARWSEMGASGRALVEDRFDIRKEAQKLELLYQKCITQ